MSVDTTTEELQADSGEVSSEDADRGRGLILIVDDDRNHAEGSRDVLEMVGFRCDVATSGESKEIHCRRCGYGDFLRRERGSWSTIYGNIGWKG